ncbi:MAG: DUF2066 domain-containing protein, partial [Steroidobacteraceae bacterium]
MKARAHGLVTSLLLLCCALPPSAWALRPVMVYEVDLDSQSATALQDAMREALVRATGRRESAQDPALGSIVTEAAKYVKSYATGPRGEPQVVFDAAAVERAIGTAGRSLWDNERPFTLVVLSPPPARTDADSDRALIEHAAEQRGLPISMIPLTVVDANGNALGADALLEAAQSYGGDQVLVGRTDSATAPGQLQWTLYTRAASDSWSGPLTDGVDHTVDLLAPPPGASAGTEEVAATSVQIEGVNGLTDYANLERLLQSVPGVRQAGVTEVTAAGVVTFEVSVRGGAAGLERALAGSTRLA